MRNRKPLPFRTVIHGGVRFVDIVAGQTKGP